MDPSEMLGKTVMYQVGRFTFNSSTVEKVIDTTSPLSTKGERLLTLADGSVLRERDAHFVVDSVPTS